MWRDADPGETRLALARVHGFEQLQKLLDRRRTKTTLTRIQWFIDPAVQIEHGQERETDPSRGGRRDHPLGELSAIVIARAVRRVMQVMELGDGCEALFEHLDERLRADGFDV